MSTRRRIHRSLAILASGGAAAALALIPATGAHANVQAQFFAGGNASADNTGTGGGTCDLTSGDDSVTTSPIAFTHGTKRRSANLSATFTNSLDSSDQVTVKGHTDSSLTLKRANGDLREFDLTGGGTVSISHTVLGSECHASGLMGAAVQSFKFTEHKKGWLTITRNIKTANGLTEYVLVNVATGNPVSLEVSQGGASTSTSKALLKPGTYGFEQVEVAVTAGGAGILAKSGQQDARAKQTLELNGVFKPLKKKHH